MFLVTWRHKRGEIDREGRVMSFSDAKRCGVDRHVLDVHSAAEETSETERRAASGEVYDISGITVPPLGVEGDRVKGDLVHARPPRAYEGARPSGRVFDRWLDDPSKHHISHEHRDDE